jgi:dTDP-4-amino-4,6-dideoxygalactose transaminase
MIPFNKPHITGDEAAFIRMAGRSGKISGNGRFTQKCQRYFEERFGFSKCLLTNSCTDALEMAALLCNIRPGDEVIMPSYTFVSTANAFVLRGAKIVFCDSRPDHPGMDEDQIEALITPETRVIVPVHYAGVACDMDKIMRLAKKRRLFVVEDAAQAVDGIFIGADKKPKPLGSIGHFSAFSFHETKNVISGEGGMLVVNGRRFEKRAEIIWEKGTNRAQFYRGEVNKYGWVDVGSSFLPSEITAAFLWGQTRNLEKIQNRRLALWNAYRERLEPLFRDGLVRGPSIPDYATNNGHMFYLVCGSLSQRDGLIAFLRRNGIMAIFHYLPLHRSPYFRKQYAGGRLKCADLYSDRLVRLPFYYSLKPAEVKFICEKVAEFFRGRTGRGPQ